MLTPTSTSDRLASTQSEHQWLPGRTQWPVMCKKTHTHTHTHMLGNKLVWLVGGIYCGSWVTGRVQRSCGGCRVRVQEVNEAHSCVCVSGSIKTPQLKLPTSQPLHPHLLKWFPEPGPPRHLRDSLVTKHGPLPLVPRITLPYSRPEGD